MTSCPIPDARGTQRPVGLCTNGVMLLGEAMGDREREEGYGFVEDAPAGSVLERAINRAGFRREQFLVWNVCPTQPPRNFLEGAPYEAEAIAWGLEFLPPLIEQYKPRVILALGNVALKATTGLNGISEARGYPLPSRFGIPVIGALHPAFLRRGAMSHLGVLMHDIRFAVALAAVYTHSTSTVPVEFWSPVRWRQVRYDISLPLRPLNEPDVPSGYILYPSESEARDFLRQAESQPDCLIAYDIETPYSHDTKEDETDELGESEILSVQFSMAPESGIFLPFREPFIEVARTILSLGNPKVGANNWRFDDPRLLSKDIRVSGTRHDLRWAWKHFQPDLSAGLQFITSFYAPELGPWKHLDKSHPQFYGIRDCDAVLRCL